MSLVNINWHPDKKGIRDFGKAMLIGFGIIGLVFALWPWGFIIHRSWHVALGCWIFAAVVGGIGLTGSRLVMPVYLVWMGIAFVMGSILGRILVGALFYLLITPMGLGMRLIGRDKLQIKKPETETYWKPRTHPGLTPEDYERQF